MVQRGLSRRETLVAGSLGVAALSMLWTAPALAQSASEADRIDALVGDFMQAFEIPGIGVALVRAGGPALLRGYGVRRMGGTDKVDTDTLFAIASNSKGFVSAGIAMLVEAGKLAWDEPVLHYLPDFATSDSTITKLMTVRDLLCHRSGLPLGAGDLMQFPLTDHSRSDMYHGLRFLPFEHGFRSGYAYDNILYVVAGVLIERVSGMAFEEYMMTQLLRPLGMRTAVADRSRLHGSNVAARHAKLGPPARGLGPLSVVEPDESLAASPAGGIHASVTDIALWLRTQLAPGVTPAGLRLWSDANAAEMWKPQVITGGTEGPSADNPARSVISSYALGWNVGDYRGHRIISHAGGVSGQVTWTAMLPEQGIGLAVFTNIEDFASAQLRNAILDLVIAAPAFDWRGAAQRVSVRNEAEMRKEVSGSDFSIPPGKPSLPLASYTGRYRDPWYGDIAVREDKEKLRVDFTRTPVFKSVLEPFGADTFRTRFAPGAGEDAVITFVIEGGRPIRLKLHALSPLADFSYDFQHLVPVRID